MPKPNNKRRHPSNNSGHRKKHAFNNHPNKRKRFHNRNPNPRPFAAPDELSLPSSPSSVHRLLEPFSKDRLVDLLVEAANDDPSIVAAVTAAADADTSHRKLFVYNLAHDTTTEALESSFRCFGEIAECNVVVDKQTGKCKGFGFVTFCTRAAATAALEEPYIQVGSRNALCQLASLGAPASGNVPSSGSNTRDVVRRRVYVVNVPQDADKERLRDMFSTFGELESGPHGFDLQTGRSKGYALFVYKTAEGAKNALEEQHKLFDGRTLHCQYANDPNQKKGGVGDVGFAGAGASAMSQPMLTTAAQNLALYGQNQAYGALLGGNPLLAAAALNPTLAAASLNPALAAVLNPAMAAPLNPAVAATFNPTTLAALNQASAAATMNPSGSSFHNIYGADPSSIPGRTHGSHGQELATSLLGPFHGANFGQPSSSSAGNWGGQYGGYTSY